MIKEKIKNILLKAGYDLKKLPSDRYGIALYKRLYSPESLEKKRFYNIGAGKFYHPYWTNVDHISEYYKGWEKYTRMGINYDLFSLEPLPIENNVAEIIYSSHTIEHINNESALYMFKEAFRVLKPKGIIRITAPDIDLHYRAYKNNDLDFFYFKDIYEKPVEYKKVFLNSPLNKCSAEQLFLSRFAVAASVIHVDGNSNPISDAEFINIFNSMKYEDALDYCTSRCTVEIQKKYPGNHMNWWNKQKTAKMLKEAGFNLVMESGYGQSQAAVLRNLLFFDKSHPTLSFYIEAIKD
jgi:hypothetical protein